MSDDRTLPKALSALAMVVAGSAAGGAFANTVDSPSLDQQLVAATRITLATDTAGFTAVAGDIAQAEDEPKHVDEIHHHGVVSLAALEDDASLGSDAAAFNV